MASVPSFIAYLSKAKFTDKQTLQALIASVLSDPQSFYDDNTPTYQQEAANVAKELVKRMDDKQPINITTDFDDDDDEVAPDSIAYHRIFGPIIADSAYPWYFSTKRLITNIKDAEKNPNIIAHFIHISTGGGEAWLLDKGFEAIRDTNKPVIVFGEKVVASAGLYFAAAGNKIYTYTQNDTWGSLGTMIYFINILPAWIKQGVQEVEYYATKSDLKNKKFNDLIDGKPEDYIKEELNPLQEQFESAVRSVRPIVAKLAADHEVVRGQTFTTAKAIEFGLVDEMAEIETALLDTYNRGMAWKSKQKAQQNAYSYL